MYYTKLVDSARRYTVVVFRAVEGTPVPRKGGGNPFRRRRPQKLMDITRAPWDDISPHLGGHLHFKERGLPPWNLIRRIRHVWLDFSILSLPMMTRQLNILRTSMPAFASSFRRQPCFLCIFCLPIAMKNTNAQVGTILVFYIYKCF